ncbi:RING-type zinc-finger domain-containing protein [Phanerochaete sordida]|uniref:RING-type zinc-finger domain-containing protein n=1 Tax=Phanerochaete sordida TaxID=48140 RepID=A0A9P3GN65_9APHY|nr:RING-type zinc-finger domain-containing protein [Phanerochaete sordida]
MPTCLICLNVLRTPAALPCGHVFCHECIVKVVRNVQPFTQQHFCPSCRVAFTITTVDPQLIPHHLRPHMTPAIRKLNLDFTIPSPVPGSTPASECDRLRAENASLRSCCEVWRKRAAVHASASLGLVGLARLARDHAIKMRKENCELQQKYISLKRKYDEPDLISPPAVSALPELMRSPSRPSSPASPPQRSPSPCRSELSYCSDCSDCEPCLKRLRVSSDEPEIKQSPAPSPMLSLAPAPLEDSEVSPMSQN